MEKKYKITSQRKGKDFHSKVYLLEELLSGKELIVKIYEKSRLKYYQREKMILDYIHYKKNDLNNKNDYFIMYKEIQFHPNMFYIPDEVTGYNLQFLFFDYISKFSLLDYISGQKKYVEEIHAKFLCHELLIAIKNLHKINIYPNNLDIFNIMFDSQFHLKMIHFCEAEIIINDDNKTKFNNDLFYLAKILAKLITYGHFKSINFNKKKQYFEIKANFQKNAIEESNFWEMLKSFDIKISEEFLNFFHILIKAKLSKEIIDIDNLLKNEWLNEVNDRYEISKVKFYEDFERMYQSIIEDRTIENKFDINLDDIIDKNPNKNDDLFSKSFETNKGDYLSGDQIQEKRPEDRISNQINNNMMNNSFMNSPLMNNYIFNNIYNYNNIIYNNNIII